MSMPSQLQVLGIPFKVELVKFDDENQFGEMHGMFRKIQINQDLDSRRQWSTLLHEYVHATLYVMGAASVLEHGLEECITQSLEHGIEQLLQQVGPELVRAFEIGD